MNILSADTNPKIEAMQIQSCLQAGHTSKMHMQAQLNASAHILAVAGQRLRHPHDIEAELARRLADLLLGEDLARKVYGDISFAK
jgi:hypothetical protein